LLESHHAPAFTMEWRTHPFVKIVYVLKGRGQFLFDHETARFSAGDVIVVPPQRRNRVVDDPAAASSLYVCCIAVSLLSFDRRLPQRLRPGPLPVDGHFANRVAALMRRMVHAQSHESDTRPVAMVADALRMIQVISERSWQRRSPQQTPQAPEQQAV